MLNADHRRYLGLLGFACPPSGLEGLREITRRHLYRVPFENIGKLLLFAREGAGRTTTLPEFLDGIERLDLGGTCYTSNPFLTRLLRALGYDAGLLGADMSSPNVHTVIRVHIDGVEYHVDVGYGAPFLEPIRLDQLPHEMTQGAQHYIFDRTRPGEYAMAVYFRGERVHGYAVHDPPRELHFFAPIVIDSFQPGKTFMSCLRIVRCFPAHTVELLDRTLIVHRGTQTTEITLNNLGELRKVIDHDLAMPRCPIEQAVAILERITGTGFFETSDPGKQP